MTANEKLILDIDLLDPVFLVRPDLMEISKYRMSSAGPSPICKLQFSADGQPKAMHHIQLGWIGYPPGHPPKLEMNRITEFRIEKSNALMSTTYHVVSEEILKKEEVQFRAGKVRKHFTTNYRNNVEVSFTKEYFYDVHNRMAEVRYSSLIRGAQRRARTIMFKRDAGGLIKLKHDIQNSIQPSEAKITTYNYDRHSRLTGSIANFGTEIMTLEYRYQDPYNPLLLTDIMQKVGIKEQSLTTHLYNRKGDPIKTIRKKGTNEHIINYNYMYRN